MSTDSLSLIVNCIHSQPGVVSVQTIGSDEYKAIVDVRFELSGHEIKTYFLASEARLYAEIELDSLLLALRNQILSEWKLNSRSFVHNFSPFEITLWRDKQMYSVLPALKTLADSQGLKFQLSTHPLIVEDPIIVTEAIEKLYLRLRQGLSITISTFNSNDITVGKQEGQSNEYLSKRYERSTKNRAVCLAFHGYSCSVCKISFETVYGELGKNFIHVHHLEPLALSGAVVIDPIRDLIPICPNCHAMLHRRWPPLTPEELSSQLKCQWKSL